MTDFDTIKAIVEQYVKEVDRHMIDELIDLFNAPQPAPAAKAPEVEYFYRDCDPGHLTRTLDKTKPNEDVIAVLAGPYGKHLRDGYRVVVKAVVDCRHEWSEGFSMNGPTRTCIKCGKFERD
ncbi:hypothetical protein EVC29_082 [Rhizobium phage RHph_Y52]|nr:hypothetical protein EVB53_080 [Rhizobium phage RHph_Y60]QIG75311.1 hypothetical protein EVC16_082 [Rhizobium phage RHph_Y21]QIG76783.1 hypothetical protein EVC29_082 [Rhizobium phage RHph_Y52]